MTSSRTAGAVICGAGIAGVAAAYYLTVRCGVSNVVICDPRPPLTLTSDKSTECYRNWWPSPPMVEFMGRSIDLLEEVAIESGNTIQLSRRGYLYVTGDDADLEDMITSA
ncbi:MAG: FAD-dependent oxidoreductase, partial [Actinomycetota bacterium]|nr:FAD-dependent oxidoreductase [Actinomycetota bacterium]